MHKLKVGLLALFIISLGRTPLLSQVSKADRPTWVDEVQFQEMEVESEIDNGGYHYLLLDIQDNLSNNQFFSHYAIKILNTEGIQQVSDIEVVYDPSYEKVQFHRIQIIRDGKVIDRLKDIEINTIQRERNSDRNIYDGSLSAIIHLKDVREKDIVEYSYTLIGSNPVLKKNYCSTYYHEYSQPVFQVRDRIIIPSGMKLNYTLYEGASKPVTTEKNGNKEYIWDEKIDELFVYENNVPNWYNPLKRVSVTTFDSWGDVVQWAIPLFEFEEVSFDELEATLVKMGNSKNRISAIIRFVQDEVRYLAFEDGIASYTPHTPKLVYDNRFGDCKDKSLLLVSLLEREGIKAHPLFVNSSLGKGIEHLPPGQDVFNHCVVQFEYEDSLYYIDPTISLQGGGLETTYFPNYAFGLLIKEGESSLTRLPKSPKPTVHVSEIITVDSIGGYADLIVVSTYDNVKADDIRWYFNNNSAEVIKQDYLNFYSNLYSDIESTGEVKLYDESRDDRNQVKVEEYYRIHDFWQADETGENLIANTSALLLQSMVSYPGTPNRTMPYSLLSPFSYTQSTQIILPIDWELMPFQDSIRGDGYDFSVDIEARFKSIFVNHFYELKKDHLDPSEVDDFLVSHEKINNMLTYEHTHRIGSDVFKISWLSFFIMIALIGVFTYLAFVLQQKYNPAPNMAGLGQEIGGWLVLPAIGLVLSPFVLIYQLSTSGMFDENIWINLSNAEVASSLNLYLFIIWEMIFNCAFVVFTFLLIYLFFKRRTATPNLMMIFYAANIILPVLDLLLMNQIFDTDLGDSDSDVRDIIKAVVAGAIWIPYFKISSRVKNTFTVQLKD